MWFAAEHRTGAARARGVGGARLLHAAPWACYVTVNHGSAPGARASAGGRDARNHVVVGPGLPAERPAGWRCCLGALAATIPPGRGAGPVASPPLRHRVRKPPAGPATAQLCSAPDHQEWPAAFAGAAARHWGRAVARRRDPERSEPVSGVSSELKSDVLMRISTVEKTRNPPNSSARCAQPFFNSRPLVVRLGFGRPLALLKTCVLVVLRPNV